MSIPNRSMNLLYFPFRERLESGLLVARKNGHNVYLFEGYRSPQRQKEMYDQGRVNALPIVTRAQPFRSNHQYGIAGDVVFKTPEGKWTWDLPSKDWRDMAKYLKAEGLSWLGDSTTFPEMPHFELQKKPDLNKLQQLYIAGGIIAVWDYIDTAQ